MSDLLTILRGDVKPAMGCTGPVSVIFAAAAAREAVGGELRSLRLIMDKDTYKNSIAVYTPGTPYKGVLYPAVLGAIYGKSAYGLEVIRDLGEDWDRDLVARFAAQTQIEIFWEQKHMGIYIEVYAQTDRGTGHVIVAKEHDKVVFLEANGEILRQEEGFDPFDQSFEGKKPINAYTLRDFYDFAVTVPGEDIAFLAEAAQYNLTLADAGLEQAPGGAFGKGFAQMGDTLALRIKALTGAASDARMAGVPLSAMSCGGSGNVGITACVPLAVIAEDMGASQEALHRAICLSYLCTIKGKACIGRLSPMCACAIVAALGVAAGTVLLMGGDFQAVDLSIKNLLGSLGGVLCDGAKYGCALKLANAAGTAYDCALLAIQGRGIPSGDGVVCDTAEDSLILVGKLASKGMLQEDELLCREMLARETRPDGGGHGY